MLRKGILPVLFAVLISFAGTRLVACAGPAWPNDEERRFLEAYRDSVGTGASDEQFAHADKLYVEALQVLSETYVEKIDRMTFIDSSIAALGELETDDTSPVGIVGAALDDSLHNLDPHSAYMTDDMFRRLQESTEGSFAGVGIVIALDDDKRIRIVSPIDDTPAARAGLRPDDRITHIDGYQMEGEPISEAVRRMRGRVGDPVTLTIQRVQDSFDVTVKRARIEVPSVTASIIDQDIGYIRVSRFDATTLDQAQEYLGELEEKIASPRGIIVDLRRNPGGLLDSAADIADQFLSDGLIVATEGRGERKLRSYEADRSDFFDQVPMAILLDRGSASGAELMAAALRENGRGVIIGERSFGKGSMQRIMPLTSGGGLKITTGYYTTPKTILFRGMAWSPISKSHVPMTMSSSARSIWNMPFRHVVVIRVNPWQRLRPPVASRISRSSVWENPTARIWKRMLMKAAKCSVIRFLSVPLAISTKDRWQPIAIRWSRFCVRVCKTTNYPI